MREAIFRVMDGSPESFPNRHTILHSDLRELSSLRIS
jgi:hypothetical protein